MKTAMFFIALFAAGTAAQAAPPDFQATVVVRTYDYSNSTRETLSSARGEAEQIFKAAQIAVRWTDCNVPGKTDGAACTEPLLAGRELMLRLIDRAPANPADTRRVMALGESLVDREERGGVLMTVDVFPVRAIAERAATSLAILLGRAMAHEIGHLLLGSAGHARLGLMRALWSHDELRGAKPANWGFSAREAAQMRQTLRGRTRTAD
jgi:hypothetical protein